ncbi:MAG: response regulator transcription factor [bacterium]|nr:response regulator transcription factor [bacterium]
MQKVLVVDDEPQIRKQLKIGLGGYGYQVLTAINGEDALMLVAQQHPDLVLLDISLGSLPDGIEVCKQLREWSKVPIIMLSIHEEQKIKITALNLGADDYITKPFDMEELHARIQAIFRRITTDVTTTKSEIRVGELVINMANRTVFVAGEQVHLTPKEYDLLRLLATHQGKVLTHRTILNTVWGTEYADMDHYVRVFINQLRKKIGENPARNLRYILNEPGVGYRFVEPKS